MALAYVAPLAAFDTLASSAGFSETGLETSLVDRKWISAGATLEDNLETATPPPGFTRYFRVTSAQAAAKNHQRTISDQNFCVAGPWRYDGVAPSSAQRLLRVSPTNHDVRVESGGDITVGASSTSFVTIASQAQLSARANEWLWIVVKCDCDQNPHTITVTIRDYYGNIVGTADTADTSAVAAATQTNIIWGTGGAATGTQMDFGPLHYFDSDGDYAAAKIPHGAQLLVPSADGTHSFTNGTPDDFQNQADTDFSGGNAATVIWQNVEEVPPTITEHVRQKVIRSTGYVEIDYPSLSGSTALYKTPTLVQLCAALHPVGAQTANTCTFHLNDGGTITAETVRDTSVATDTLEYRMHGYQVRPNGGGAWDVTSINALRARFGYSTDVTPNPALDGIYIFVVGPLHIVRTIGQAEETNTANAMARAKSKLLGQNTETDTAGVITPVDAGTVVAVAQASETDTAQPMGKAKLKVVGQTTETDTANAITRAKLRALGQTTETDTANAFTHTKLKAFGQASETDAAQAITRAKQKAIGQTSETDTANAFAHLKARLLGQATETDTAQAIAKAKLKAFAQATETDLAQAITRSKSRALGQASETDTANAFARSKLKLLGQATETDLAQALAHLKSRLLGQASETDLAQAMTVIQAARVSQVEETDSAFPITRAKQKAFGQASETDSAFPFVHTKLRLVGQATEADLAQPISRQKARAFGQASEIDQAFALAATKLRQLGLAAESDSAGSITSQKVKLLGQASEADTALLVAAVKVVVLGLATETDAALPMIVFGLRTIFRYGSIENAPEEAPLVSAPVHGNLGNAPYEAGVT